MNGAEGNDILAGGENGDHMWGGYGDDILWGRDGDDSLPEAYGETRLSLRPATMSSTAGKERIFSPELM